MYLTDEQIMLLEQLTYLTDDLQTMWRMQPGCSSARMTAWRICSSSLMMMRCKGLKIREILTAQNPMVSGLNLFDLSYRLLKMI